MKYRLIAALLCCLLLFSSCKEQAVTKEQEESGGTGYGVSQKSAITLQDLYDLRPGTARETVLSALGSAQSFIIAENNTDTYRLADGETLVLTYTEAGKIKTAVLTDTSGKKQDFFGYLNELGILLNYTPGSTVVVEEPDAEKPEPESPDETPVVNVDGSGYFSGKQYSYELADQILAIGAERETVVSALGKPNSFSSVSFRKDSYLVDVYSMEDGSTLYLDYGYTRTKLRAVQKIKGGAASNYLGSWEEEEKPSGYLRTARNAQLFSNLKKNAKPSEIYRRFGAPDWLEGNTTRYRDAYQLLDGSVFYLDFGSDHNALTAAVLQKSNGTIVNYTLR
ncbi:MAG: hypothetical protein IJ043_11500 [Clostridia bacterium]|nr:hypothetical protein [Clostridia bacterium]